MPYDFTDAVADLLTIVSPRTQHEVQRVLDLLAEKQETELAQKQRIHILQGRLIRRRGEKAPTSAEMHGLSIHVDNALCQRLSANCLVMDSVTYELIKKHIAVEAATTDDV